MKSRYLYDCK